jgi:hypothetical protein
VVQNPTKKIFACAQFPNPEALSPSDLENYSSYFKFESTYFKIKLAVEDDT